MDTDALTALVADVIERDCRTSPEKAQAVAQRIMAIVAPPFERQLKAAESRATEIGRQMSDRKGRVFNLMDRLCQTLESMLRYHDHISPRHGHLVDVPLDDRAALDIEYILREWRTLGGQLLTSRPETRVYRDEHQPSWSANASNASTLDPRRTFGELRPFD